MVNKHKNMIEQVVTLNLSSVWFLIRNNITTARHVDVNRIIVCSDYECLNCYFAEEEGKKEKEDMKKDEHDWEKEEEERTNKELQKSKKKEEDRKRKEKQDRMNEEEDRKRKEEQDKKKEEEDKKMEQETDGPPGKSDGLITNSLQHLLKYALALVPF